MQRQIFAAVTIDQDDLEPTPARPTIQQSKVGSSSSWFTRRGARKTQETAPKVEHKPPPVSVDVTWDDLHARSETEYGLFETKRAKAVFIAIHVR